MGTLLYMALIVGFMWFFLFRPQQQQAKKRAEMLSKLRSGDKIVTIGGICGVVKALNDTKVYIEIADGLTIEMLRTAISQVDNEEAAVEDEEDEEEYDEDDDLYYDDDEYEDDVIDVEVENKK